MIFSVGRLLPLGPGTGVPSVAVYVFMEFFLECMMGVVDTGESVAVLNEEVSESLERDLLDREDRVDFCDVCVSLRWNDG